MTMCLLAIVRLNQQRIQIQNFGYTRPSKYRPLPKKVRLFIVYPSTTNNPLLQERRNFSYNNRMIYHHMYLQERLDTC